MITSRRINSDTDKLIRHISFLAYLAVYYSAITTAADTATW